MSLGGGEHDDHLRYPRYWTEYCFSSLEHKQFARNFLGVCPVQRTARCRPAALDECDGRRPSDVRRRDALSIRFFGADGGRACHTRDPGCAVRRDIVGNDVYPLSQSVLDWDEPAFLCCFFHHWRIRHDDRLGVEL